MLIKGFILVYYKALVSEMEVSDHLQHFVKSVKSNSQTKIDTK